MGHRRPAADYPDQRQRRGRVSHLLTRPSSLLANCSLRFSSRFLPTRKWPWGKWLARCSTRKKKMMTWWDPASSHLHNLHQWLGWLTYCGPLCRPLQGAHSTSGADNEYNLRSRTVICDSCGQTSDRGGSGGLPEGLGGHSFFMGTNQPRKVGVTVTQSSIRERINTKQPDDYLSAFFFFLLNLSIWYLMNVWKASREDESTSATWLVMTMWMGILKPWIMWLIIRSKNLHPLSKWNVGVAGSSSTIKTFKTWNINKWFDAESGALSNYWVVLFPVLLLF